VAVALSAAADVRFLTPVKDTYVQSTNPDLNFGTSKMLHLGKGVDLGKGLIRTLVEYDLASLPTNPNLIASAKFSVYQTKAEGGQGTVRVDLCRATQAWAEGSVTWTSTPTFDPSPWASADLGQEGFVGWVDWDVTALVRAHVSGQQSNLGWLFRVQNEDAAPSHLGYYDSRETLLDDIVNPPLLTVEIVPEPLSLALLGVLSLFARRR
jgi:hypothetical protein